MSQRKPKKAEIERAINNLQEALIKLRNMDDPSPTARMCIQMALSNLGVADSYPSFTIGESNAK